MILKLVLLLCVFHSIHGQTSIYVGLVTDRDAYPQASNVLARAIEDARSTDDVFTLRSESSSLNGCGTGMMEGAGTYQLCDFYSVKNISAVFGPTCFKDLQMSARLTEAWNILQFNFWADHPSDLLRNTVIQMTTRSAVNILANLIAAFTTFGWDKIVLFRCPLCFSDTAQGLAATNYVIKHLPDGGITVLDDRTFLPTDTAANISSQLNETKARGRIFLALAGSNLTNYVAFLQAVAESGMPPSDYAVVVVVPLYDFNGLMQPWRTTPSLAPYYQNLIIIYNDCYDSSTARAFAARMGISKYTTEELLLYMQLYESVYFYSDLIEYQRSSSNASDLLHFARNQLFAGPFGNYTLNEVTNRITPFRVVYLNSTSATPVDIATISLKMSKCSTGDDNTCSQLIASMIDYGMDTIDLPLDMPVCGFDGELCEQTSTILVIIGIVIGLAIIGVLVFVYRRMRGNEIREMPWSLPRQSFAFIDVNKTLNDNSNKGGENAGDSSFHSLQLLQELGPQPATPDGGRQSTANSEHKRDRGRRVPMPPKTHLATLNNNFALVYSYPFIDKRSTFNREEIQVFYSMKQSVHDNLNAFLGCSFDSDIFLVAWTMCFKGTLTEVLNAQLERAQMTGETGLTNNFRGAFVRDMLKGLEFLHASSIQYHGALIPNNCLVDSHWILKLSGFGINKILNRWQHKRTIMNSDRSMFIPNSELHYYAPEIRAWWKDVHESGKNDLGYIPGEMGKLGDIYSFGMILYEILYAKKYVDIEDAPPVVHDEDSAVSEVPNFMFDYTVEAKIPRSIDVPENDEIHSDLRKNMINMWDHTPAKRTPLLLMRRITDSTLKMTGSLVDQMMRNLEQYTNNLENIVKERTAQLEIEQRTADDLLHELLPQSVANELKMGRRVEPKTFNHATILYSDIVGFTALCSESSPIEVVALLSGIFQAFDNIISHHNTYKVETIGDAYMIASGVPEHNKNHVKNVAAVALMNREFLQDFEIPHRPGQYLHCRWGFNSGPVFTGVVGFNAPRYVIFGPTVALAAKMESSGIPDKIQMTVKSHQLLTARFPEFKCSPRGSVRIAGMGTFLTYWLDGVEELLLSDRSSYKRVIAEEATHMARAISNHSNRRESSRQSMHEDLKDPEP